MNTETTTASPKKTNWIILIGIIITVFVLLVGLIIALVLWLGSGPMQAGQHFLTQLSTKQIDQGYNSASIQFKESISKEDFSDFLSKYTILTKTKNVSFTSFNIESSFATLGGSMTATDGQVSPLTMQLVNENGQWRVLNIDLNPPAPRDNMKTFDEIGN